MDTFTVKFITPGLIGEADTEMVDKEVGLRGPSLRGCLRFWARAALRPLLPSGPDQEVLKNLKDVENVLFGSTSQQGFRLRIEPPSGEFWTKKKEVPRLPHKRNEKPFWKAGWRQGIREGKEFKVSVRWALGTEPKEKEALSAVVWLWGNLGSIGNRERRGFGSVWVTGEDPFDFSKWDWPKDGSFLEYGKFEDKAHLENYLKTGIEQASEKLYGLLGITWNAANLGASLDDCINTKMFQFKSLNQVFVGESVGNVKPNELTQKDAPLARVHGVRHADPNEHGDASHRPASPTYVRLHQSKAGYHPVVTISPRRKQAKYSPDYKTWLSKNLKLQKSLGGSLVYPDAPKPSSAPAHKPKPDLPPNSQKPSGGGVKIVFPEKVLKKVGLT